MSLRLKKHPMIQEKLTTHRSNAIPLQVKFTDGDKVDEIKINLEGNKFIVSVPLHNNPDDEHENNGWSILGILCREFYSSSSTSSISLLYISSTLFHRFFFCFSSAFMTIWSISSGTYIFTLLGGSGSFSVMFIWTFMGSSV